ncbi:hypothetical protein C882_0554 [Caenispirillum salinarum AK4]|uniref:Membrane fusion protein (MFP) family protein n=1 Tax=Caenispirillum salinarum AK4 TaxID=1238182 RepID=K9GVL8_9PROT|nr:HlyD family type I secretion periplasmic adaptor subunit [Caenispirillum salinarum]EKV29247.1 hypothetical protein C882_0554 [Caenispirillum salinarum AK4]
MIDRLKVLMGRPPDDEARAAGERPAASLSRLTRGSRRLGYGVAIVFFGGLGTWAAVAPLAGAAVAPGVVSPDGHRKTVQHLEGGILRAIHVREGQAVQAGEPLVTLEDTRALAEYRELRERILHLTATEARLTAEQADAAAIAWPDALASPPAEDDAATATTARAGEKALFDSRRAARQGRERILSRRVAQLDEEITGLRQVIAAQEEQVALIAEEIANVEQLYRSGLERLPRLLALKRQQADIRAEMAANRASIARNGQKIGETEMERLTLRQQDHERVSEELTRVRAELARLRSQAPSRADVLARRLVRAPIDGRVMNVRVTTEAGGVLGAGEPILDIVPEAARLVVEARVKPVDIDTVRPGMAARVVLTAYRQRSMPQIVGTLRSISADRLTDEASGEPYFLARVEVDPEALETAGGEDVRLMAGMPADVMILTGTRTMLDYLIQPLAESVRRSFRES